jgi:5-dehydro-2-deoxygluconokinase
MTLGYNKPLYLLAFDHRGSFEHDLFNATHPISGQVQAGIIDAKEVIYEAFVEAVGRGVPVDAAGILVDEQYGASVARKAQGAGHVLAMPVEKSGQAEFDFEYGESFGSHIEEFDPTFAKVLVRFNPDGDQELNRRQTERLARLSTWLHARDRRFLFELLVPATDDQLRAAGGDHRRYDRDIRPELVVRIIEAMQDGGVEPDIWKIEGLDSTAACTGVVAAARQGGRDSVCCIVLGRGADEPQVVKWLGIAAAVPGFDGFAVGRTLWEEPLRDLISGQVERVDAVHTIADRYLETVKGFTG